MHCFVNGNPYPKSNTENTMMKTLGIAFCAAAAAGIGTFVYIHMRRGGRFTQESLSGTAKDLLGDIEKKANKLVHRAERELHNATDRAQATAQTAASKVTSHAPH
jgi:hypothetical protein